MIRLRPLRNPGIQPSRDSLEMLRQEQMDSLPVATEVNPAAEGWSLSSRLRQSKSYKISGHGGLWKWAKVPADLSREPGYRKCYAKVRVRNKWTAKTYTRFTP